MNTKPTYWQRYDKVFKLFSYKKIFSKILRLTKKLGTPFSKKSKRGRKFKISPMKYTAYIVFEMITGNSPYRDMELGSELYVNEHIDHSTFGKNFIRIPYDYLTKLLEKCAKMLETLLGIALVYIADSTGMVTHTNVDSIHKGKKIKRKKTYKAHSLVGYYPNKKITYIKTGLGTDKHISDSKGAKQMLQSYDLGWAYFSADSNYDFEECHKAIKEKNLYPLVKPRKNKLNRAKVTIKHREKFNKRIYKEVRHIIETVFGGLENKGLLKTKLRRTDNINKYSVIVQIRHNIRTLMKLMSYLFRIVRQTLLINKIYKVI